MSEKPLYLQKLRLGGFRAYHKIEEITFPDGPSLTVIVGPNGLGKSTLFDGIEWGLTGKLKRMENLGATASDIGQSIGTDPFIELMFDDETCIQRTRPNCQINNSAVSIYHPSNVLETTYIANKNRLEPEIVKWLAKSHWQNMESIADCLHFTHFLGQSTRQLFVHQDGKERWNRLQGPAGVKTLWDIEQALGRQATTNALNRQKESLNVKLQEVQQQQHNVQTLQKNIQQQKVIARTQSALSSEEIHRRLDIMQNNLKGYFGCHEQGLPNDIDNALECLKKNLEQIEQDLYEKKTQLEQWKYLAVDYQQLGDQENQYTKAIGELGIECNKAEVALKQAIDEETEQKDKFEKAQEILKQDQIKFDKLIKAINLHEHVALANNTLQDITYSLDKHKQEENVLITIVNDLTDALENVKTKQNQYNVLIQRLSEVNRLNNQAKVHYASTQRLQAAEHEVLIENEKKLKLIQDQRASEEVLKQTQISLDQLLNKRSEAIQKADSVATAVAQIAATLSDDDCECPVCKSSFNGSGVLKKLAQKSAMDVDARIAEIEVEYQFTKIKQDDAKLLLVDINNQLTKIADKEATRTKEKEDVFQLEQQLRSDPRLATNPTKDFITIINQVEEKLQQSIKTLRDEISRTTPATDIESQLKTQVANLELAKAQTQNTMSALENSRTTSEELINRAQQAAENSPLFSQHQTDKQEASKNINSEHQTSRQILQTAILAHQQSLEQLQQGLDNAQSKRQKLKNEHTALTQDINSALQKRDTIISSRDLLSKRWKSLVTDYELSVQAVTEKLSELPSLHAQLLGLKIEHKQLLDGKWAYANQMLLKQFENEFQQLQDLNDAHDINTLQQKLTDKEQIIEKDLRRLENINNTRDSILVKLKERNNEIRNNISIPLNASVAKFCAALMTDRNYKVSVESVAKAASAQALLSFRMSEEADDLPKNPLLYLSEGQLAAVSLCLLFGASVTYPWSRWKALLLDDPLHHNDTIHAAAFIDVVRNLIKEQGYQIIVSTHDMDQAGFFLRKCSNAGISSRYWHIYGRDENGVMLDRGKS